MSGLLFCTSLYCFSNSKFAIPASLVSKIEFNAINTNDSDNRYRYQG